MPNNNKEDLMQSTDNIFLYSKVKTIYLIGLKVIIQKVAKKGRWSGNNSMMGKTDGHYLKTVSKIMEDWMVIHT